MKTPPAVVVWDIGKTNVKLCAVAADGRVLRSCSRAFSALPAPPYSHLDTGGIWRWGMRRLSELSREFEIPAIAVTAHGATAALLDGDGLALPVLDYEDPAPEQCEREYAELRPPFRETLSPRMPGGINFGRGIFWQSRAFPAAFSKAQTILCYTQYWSWRLSGVAALDVTSIGSLSELWNPRAGCFSSLAEAMQWRRLFPAIRRSDEVLGPVRPEIAEQTGLPAECKIFCGIHDSNASLLPWLGRKAPFTVVSTGTWVINMSVGASLDALDEQRGCLANVSMFAQPVACSCWMGGREFANLAGAAAPPAGARELRQALEQGVQILPPQGGAGGPFPKPNGGRGSLRHWHNADEPVQSAAAALYCALMLDVCLDLCGCTGDIIVEGPFAGNALITGALAALRGNHAVLVSADKTGTTTGAARLAIPDLPPPPTTPAAPSAFDDLLKNYRDEWRQKAASELTQ